VLLLAACAFAGMLLYKAITNQEKAAQLPRPFRPLAKAASWLTRGSESEPTPPPWSRDRNAGEPWKLSSSREMTGVAPDVNVSTGTVASTALDLMRDNQTLSQARRDVEASDPEVINVVVDRNTEGSAHPSGTANHSSAPHQGEVSSQADGAKAERPRSWHTMWSRSWGRKKAEEPPKLGVEEMELRELGEPKKDGKGRDEPQHEALWTRGVDPADVEILRDPRDQPLVLGRGAYAVVYLGRWQATLVAVKVMLASDSDAAQREVQAEADILRGLRHPNVVLLMAVCVSPGQQVRQGPILECVIA
jgi:hypothetical protein